MGSKVGIRMDAASRQTSSKLHLRESREQHAGVAPMYHPCKEIY